MTQKLALGLSGGGDSLALLHALRSTHSHAELHALIVDHGLREGSRAEAEQAADWARKAGAKPSLMTWTTPRAGQGHARLARHRLLADACLERDVGLLCLAHTLDDRVETLRMRADRSGGLRQLTGPTRVDPSPLWPQGGGVTLARPFLTLRRSQLRSYLKMLNQRWIDDPSNYDPRYERVRLRQDAWPAGDEQELDLLARSDQALDVQAGRRAAAYRLIETGAELTAWGGAQLHRAMFSAAEPEVCSLALETLVLAVSGQIDSPTPQQIEPLRAALLEGRALTGAGVALTDSAVMGRDPGSVLGRADGAAGLQPLTLKAGQTATFDGRWRVIAHQTVEIGPWGADFKIAEGVPVPLRPALMAVTHPETGELLALPGVNDSGVADFEQLGAQRIASRLLPPAVPTWFDAEECARNVEARLAKRDLKSNISV